MAVAGDAVTGRPTALPTRKVADGGIAGTVGTLPVWLYDACVLPGAPIPSEIAAALATAVAFAASYASLPAPTETVLPGEDEGPLHQHG